jgi:signal transduction histidine kinase
VTDTWIGIKKENIEKVFDRFFQDADSRNQEWYGIWLSLVKKIADLHSWKIDIESEKGVWTKVKVIF